MHQYLSEMEERTIGDYIKYCRLEKDEMQSPQVLLADFLLDHVEIMYYFFHHEEMKEMLAFYDFIKSGNTVLEKKFRHRL